MGRQGREWGVSFLVTWHFSSVPIAVSGIALAVFARGWTSITGSQWVTLVIKAVVKGPTRLSASCSWRSDQANWGIWWPGSLASGRQHSGCGGSKGYCQSLGEEKWAQGEILKWGIVKGKKKCGNTGSLPRLFVQKPALSYPQSLLGSSSRRNSNVTKIQLNLETLG